MFDLLGKIAHSVAVSVIFRQAAHGGPAAGSLADHPLFGQWMVMGQGFGGERHENRNRIG